jgi:murein L,D-transpeptidase YafK
MKKVIRYILLGLLIALPIYYFWPENQLTPGQKIDRMVINKEQRTLEVFFKGELLASYNISLGSNKWPHSKFGPVFSHPVGKKTIKGDMKTPEGFYIANKYSKGNYKPSLKINYGCDTCKKGGNILLHGPKVPWIGKFQRWADWTDGCIALTQTEIEEIYAALGNSCPIEINP